VILDSEPDIEVVAEASNGREAVSISRRLRPGVVVMDVRMPDLDGIEATRQITAHGHEPGTRVLMLTTFDIDEYVFDALRAGASGFLLKDVPAHQLAESVRMIAAGDTLLAPTVTRRLIEQFVAAAPTAPPPPGLRELTPRELEVFRLVASGMSNAEIAAELFIGDATVKTHVTRLLMKLNLRDRVQAVVLAYETGIARPGLGRVWK
jgi:DNA-binding NarL/FixJ family response regulator